MCKCLVLCLTHNNNQEVVLFFPSLLLFRLLARYQEKGKAKVHQESIRLSGRREYTISLTEFSGAPCHKEGERGCRGNWWD